METGPVALALEVEQKKEKVDYSKNLPKNKLVPEAQIHTLRTARKMIGILSHFSEEVKIPKFKYNIHSLVELPEKYIFWEIVIRFLPFWWKYEILMWEDTFNIRIPETSDEFIEDMIFMNALHGEYKKISNGTRRNLVTIAANELTNRDNSTTGFELFDRVMSRVRGKTSH